MPRGRHTLGWLGLVVLLVVSVGALYRVFANLAELGAAQGARQLLLTGMSLAVVVLALVLSGVLIRNLVRLIVDRRRGILGSRLRTKLVFFFLALVLLPAIVLFSGSAHVIYRTVRAMQGTPTSDLTRMSHGIVDQWNEYLLGQSERRASAIAAEIGREGDRGPGYRERLGRILGPWAGIEETHAVQVISGGEVLAAVGALPVDSGPTLRQQVDGLLAGLAAEVAESRRATRRMDRLESPVGGLLACAAAPIPMPASARARPGEAVAVGIIVPRGLARDLASIDAADRAFRQFRDDRRELVRLYLSLLVLIFLVTLFVATWIGLYLSRRITGPIQELAAASREISAGNLGVRVRTDAGHEMAVLVDAFNEMAGQLQENREIISRSTGDLRRSNRALDDRRRYIETLLANLSTAVVSLDTQGAVTMANPAVERILGVVPASGDDARRLFRDSGLEPLSALLDTAVGPRVEAVRRDLSLAKKSGPMNVSVQISPLVGAGGASLGTLVMVEDLTELLQAQKAAAWREIARRIAHEIKNPLTPIQLAAQRLRKKFSEGAADLNRVLPEAADSIEREVGALKDLVDEFSRFARMPELAPRRVDFARVVESVLALYTGLPEVRWDVDLQPDMKRVVLDPDQIRRVLINLIDNGITAMDGKGTIRIRAQAPAREGLLRIELADTGPGIPDEDRDKMFSPYFSTKKRGTGLGLAIVHRIVTDHRGTIRLETAEAGGARFVIEIPI